MIENFAYTCINLWQLMYFLFLSDFPFQFYFFQTDSFYPAMRLLLPHLEKERVAYGIKEVPQQ